MNYGSVRVIQSREQVLTLASLKMNAQRNGDSYVLNGSKIWTSGAEEADWIFCLVRN